MTARCCLLQALVDAEETVIVEALGFLKELCTSKQIRKPALLAAAKKVTSVQVLLS